MNLRAAIQRETCVVIRGHSGASQQIMKDQLVVGDIVVLEAGDRVPADCVLIEEMDMFVDQSEAKLGYSEQEDQNNAEKQCSNGENHLDNPDMILYADSLVMRGAGKAVVMAVGKNVHAESLLGTFTLGDEMTPLQLKLKDLSNVFTNYAILGALLTILLFSVFWLFNVMFGEGTSLVSSESLIALLQNIQIAIAILIVSVPEGMPLAVQLALAFSTGRLQEDNLLVKELVAMETSGTLLDVFTGKTQTLTSGDMTVRNFWTGNQEQDADSPQINNNLMQVITNSIILNNTARIEMNDDTQMYEPQGSSVEAGMLKFLINQEVPVVEMMRQRDKNAIRHTFIPFSPQRKIMTVAYQTHGPNSPVEVIVKGAPEVIIPLCTAQMDSNNNPQRFNGDGTEGEDFLAGTIAQYAKGGVNYDEDLPETTLTSIKPFAYAYKMMDVNQFLAMKEASNFEDDQSRISLESNLTFVAAFGLEDPIREETLSTVNELKGSTNIRILSGDHRETVIKVASDLGIIDANNPDENIMDGAEFRNVCAQFSYLTTNPDDGEPTYDFKGEQGSKEYQANMKAFKSQVKKNVCALCRATPEDKHMFVALLKRTKAPCAMTADGINDARALQEASVGFGMGSGCAVAKDSSDIIITDDNFRSLFNSIRWGRNIYDNCRKFIQFQLTINISCLFFVILGGATTGMSPFSVIQLLWINLIMDVLAAVALGTEAPSQELKKDRIKPNDDLILPVMWRTVSSQFIYQAITMIVLLYAGPTMFDISYNLVQEPLRDAEGATNRLTHYTLLFQCFVMMNLFNMWNCRVISGEEDKEWNIFAGVWRNWYFLIIFLIEVNVQYFMVGYAWVGVIFQTAPLTFGMQLTAILLGLGSWIVAAIAKATPFRYTEIFPQVAEKDDGSDPASRLISRGSGQLQRGETRKLMEGY